MNLFVRPNIWYTKTNEKEDIHLLELLILPICFAADQYTKNKAEKGLSHHQTKNVLNDRIHLQIVYNHGAFLGFLKNHKKLLMLANGLSVLILIVTMLCLMFTKGYHIAKVGVAFIAGGAAGNIYDRVKKGKVVDFFAFKPKPNIFFNLADFFVFIGGFLSVIGSAFSK